MSSTLVASRPEAGDPVATSVVARPSRVRTVVAAALALLAVYAVLSLFNDPRGTLGTDTGGKIASLRVMDLHNGLDPDVGYWAEQWDPKGSLHPLYYTRHVGDRWVNLTTLPLAYAAYPLYELGGVRAAMLLPMLGSVLAALAARALARRLDGERGGWWAFWLLGLASPLTVYALDFWEHSLGVAALLWASVFAWDVVTGRAGWRAAAVGGALMGLAATMRTEAVVYAVVIGASAVVAMRRRHRRWTAIGALALPAAATGGIVLIANQILERATLGATLRASRAAGAAAIGGGGGLTRRLEEVAVTLVGLNRFALPFDWLLGAGAVLCVVFGTWRLIGGSADERRTGAVFLAVGAAIYLVRFGAGLGFVPGLLAASPLAAVGVSRCTDRKLASPALVAVAALPFVWLFQYLGGAAPQWGGRYLLVSGALLGVVGTCWLLRGSKRTRVAIAGLAFAVTVCGVGWLHERSHAVADGIQQIVGDRHTVVISQEAHLLREGGAFYSPTRRWLTAVTDKEVRRAFGVARRSGSRTVELAGGRDRKRPLEVAGYRRGASRRLEFLPGFDVTVTTYERTA